jgi:hypothetical protein
MSTTTQTGASTMDMEDDHNNLPGIPMASAILLSLMAFWGIALLVVRAAMWP